MQICCAITNWGREGEESKGFSKEKSKPKIFPWINQSTLNFASDENDGFLWKSEVSFRGKAKSALLQLTQAPSKRLLPGPQPELVLLRDLKIYL